MTIKVTAGTPMTIDCRNCLLTSGALTNSLSFDDLGWTSTGSIYWPRLKSGDNLFRINGPCKVDVSFDTVSKKVGGWLYD